MASDADAAEAIEQRQFALRLKRDQRHKSVRTGTIELTGRSGHGELNDSRVAQGSGGGGPQ